MDSALIAKVLTTKTNGKRSIGTGYPISGELLITARHVVEFHERNSDIPIEIEWPDLKDDDGKTCTAQDAEIIYDGGDVCDVAVLKCKIPPQVHISPRVLSQQLPAAHDHWETFGFPQIGKDDEAKTRDKVSALGEFHPVDNASFKIGLTSKSDAVVKEGWCGISGAPVFKGNDLCAIIIETHTNREECFTAILIPHLLKNEEFRAACGINKLETNFGAAIEYLQGISTAKSQLFQEASKNDQALKDSSESLIGYLVKLPIPDLINLINKAQKAAKTTQIVTDLSRLVRLLLPSLYGYDSVSSIRAGKGDPKAGILKIPYATDISAETLMAAADKREADYPVISIENLDQVRPKKYRLALPPESGPDVDGQQLKDIQDDLYNRLVAGKDMDDIRVAVDEQLFNRIPLKQQRSYSTSDKKILTQRALKRDAGVDRPGYYWLWNMSPDLPDDEKDKMIKMASDLKRDYPQITFLSLDFIDVSKQADEEDLFVLLADTQLTK